MAHLEKLSYCSGANLYRTLTLLNNRPSQPLSIFIFPTITSFTISKDYCNPRMFKYTSLCNLNYQFGNKRSCEETRIIQRGLGTLLQIFYKISIDILIFLFSYQWYSNDRSSQRRCSVKKVFSKISQNSQKNAYARASF